MKKIQYTTLIISILFLTLSAGCSAAALPTPASPTRITLAMHIDDLVTLDPHRAYENSNAFIQHNTYDTLVEYQPPDMETLHPRLADSWKISEDRLVYTFSLHPGVRFSTGNHLTAEDVRYSWLRLANLKSSPSFYAAGIERVEALDELTLRVKLKTPSPAFLSILAAPAMAVMDSNTLIEHGASSAADANSVDTAGAWLDQNSAGSGPYVLFGWKPREAVTLVANPYYWADKPAINRVIIRHNSGPVDGPKMLQDGTVEILHDLDFAQVKQLEDNPLVTLSAGQTLNLVYLAMSPDATLGGPLSDKRVRQAISAAIDRQGLSHSVLGGRAVLPASLIPEGILGGTLASTTAPDLERAKKLLEDAGYANKPLALELAFGTESGSLREAAAAWIKTDLEKIGVRVTLRSLSNPDFLAEMRAQKLPFTLGLWSPDYADPTMWTDYFAYPDKGIAFRILYNNPRAAALADAVSGSRDPAAREAAVGQLSQVWTEDAVFIPLYQPQQTVALSTRVSGFTYDPLYFCDLAKLKFDY